VLKNRQIGGVVLRKLRRAHERRLCAVLPGDAGNLIVVVETITRDHWSAGWR
jgi:hypothetical protein